MWQTFVVLAVLVSVAFSASPSDNAECSQNASAAYVDINIVIDTSSNMGTANLRKIVTALSLVLPKFPIGNKYDISINQRNTRIAIITFDDTATIVANYTNINSLQDAISYLNAITIKNTTESNLYDGLLKLFYIHTNCTDPIDDGCGISYYYMRPTAMFIFAANANSASVSRVPEIAQLADFFDDGTTIAYNFNPGNADLTKILDLITYDNFANSTMYNYLGTSNTMNRDIEWSIYQANCYCGDDWGTSTYQYNATLGRWQKNRECMILSLLADDLPTTPIGLCDFNQDLEKIPAYLLTQDRATWLENNLYDFPEEETFIGRKKRHASNLANIPPKLVPFYIGLHLNAQGNWSWWNYGHNASSDGEFPSSYFNWAPGYPKTGDGCAVVDADASGQHLVWKSYGCSAASTGLALALCQAPACDATDIVCCADCYYCQLNPGCGIFPKKNAVLKTKTFGKQSKKNRLLKKMAKVNGKYVRVN